MTETNEMTIPSNKKTGCLGILKQIFHWIGRVFRFVRISIANLLVILLIVFLIFVFTLDDSVNVTKGSILVFTPKANLVEQTTPPNRVLELLLDENASNETNVHQVVKVLRHAAQDPRIDSLLIQPQSLAGASMVHLEMIGSAIREFSAAGKHVVAYANEYTQSQYVLASYADEVWLDRMGSVYFSGFSFNDIYFKQLLDKLQINVHVFRSGIYKSAVEPFMQDSMSEVVRESYVPIVQQLWSSLVEKIAENRSLQFQDVENFATDIHGSLQESNKGAAELALELGLVDELVSVSDVKTRISTITSASNNSSNRLTIDDIPSVSVLDYNTLITEERDRRSVSESENNNPPSRKSGKIAVIPVEGTILHSFDQESGLIFDTTNAIINLEQAIDDGAKAVILRVNSPGGTVLASEEIRQKIADVRERDIPVVASMSLVAASGGYWIAAETDYIFAEKSTITGSIGVFSFIPSFEDTLAKVGVSTDGVDAIDDGFRLDSIRGISETDQVVLQASVDNFYLAFLELVSNGRDMSIETVDAIAGGRIWTGLQAKENGLVDELGNFDEAAETTAKMAGLTRFELVFYDAEPASLISNPFFAKLAEVLPTINPSDVLLLQNINSIYEKMKKYINFEPRTVYAYCETCDYF